LQLCSIRELEIRPDQKRAIRGIQQSFDSKWTDRRFVLAFDTFLVKGKLPDREVDEITLRQIYELLTNSVTGHK
jgi:hypothetical protein